MNNRKIKILEKELKRNDISPLRKYFIWEMLKEIKNGRNNI